MDERKLSGTELTYIKRENSKMWFPLFSKQGSLFFPLLHVTCILPLQRINTKEQCAE